MSHQYQIQPYRALQSIGLDNSHVEVVTSKLIALRATYNGLDDDFHTLVPFREYVDMMNILMPKKEYRRENEMSGRELKK